jgi:biotin synthase
MNLDDVYDMALRARESGSTRFCMGAAWRGPSQVGPKQFERVLEMVTKVRLLGMEVCTTLGMLTEDQAKQLKTAGLSCYNHNVDTSPEYYPKITSSRTYDDRLDTLSKVRKAGLSVCSGGIIGLGESDKDRIGMLHTLATLEEHPESVPINALVAVEGTPLAKQGISGPTALEMVRCVATARILMPRSMVRLSAGRMQMNFSEQGLCFLAGANSIFAGDKLLTTPNSNSDEDAEMFGLLGLTPKPAFGGDPPPFAAPAGHRCARAEPHAGPGLEEFIPLSAERSSCTAGARGD